MALQPNQVGSQMGMANMPQPGSGNPGFFKNLSNQLFGQSQRVQQLSPYSQNQQQGSNQLLQSGLQGIQNTPLNFDPIRERLIKTYNERIVPSLNTRLSGMGSYGSQGSSGARGLLAESSGDLLQRLGELESQYNLQGRQQGIDLARLGLTPQYENIIQGRQPGLFENLATSAGGGLGSYLTGGLSNLFGGGGNQQQSGQQDQIINLLRQLLANLGG